MNAGSPSLLVATSLTRKFAESLAVTDLSLTVDRGQIVGLLGLNGAGKSSTLRMLAGVLVPDSGEITIAGHSLMTHPIAAKTEIGYLPEVAPVYPDMRVDDYVDFAARLHRVRQSRLRVQEILKELDLVSVAKRRIAHLSKGFRQRVGIAQALVHRPGLIILDEPSSGLDPEQMREMRDLVRHLGSSCGVIFSSHLLGEVNEICTDVAVLHQGRVVHDSPLASEGDRVHYRVGFARPVQPAALDALETVASARALTSTMLSVQPAGNSSATSADQLLQSLVQSGYPVVEFSADGSSLEQLFSSLVRAGDRPVSTAA
ncbi:MAG: ABC transporter ATP-binding protein [Gammaproteobacteria bacterium]|nr:ABC transporter ATP-binding protein [Gammaproteobacteria bacterium]